MIKAGEKPRAKYKEESGVWNSEVSVLPEQMTYDNEPADLSNMRVVTTAPGENNHQ